MLKNMKVYKVHAVALMLIGGAVMAAPPVAPREVNQEEPATRGQVQPGNQPGVIVQPGRPGVVVEPRREQQQTSDQRLNSALSQHVADCLILQNQEEVNLAKFAQERTKNAQVKEFAAMLIRDHEALNQKLQPYARNWQSAKSTPTFRQGERLPAETPAERREARQELREQGASPREAREITRDGDRANRDIVVGERPLEHRAGFRGDDLELCDRLFQISKQAHKNCEEMTRQELSRHSDEEFDKAFLGCQIGGHIALIAHLKASQSQVSGDLQQIISDATRSAVQHKQHADQLMKELK